LGTFVVPEFVLAGAVCGFTVAPDANVAAFPEMTAGKSFVDFGDVVEDDKVTDFVRDVGFGAVVTRFVVVVFEAAVTDLRMALSSNFMTVVDVLSDVLNPLYSPPSSSILAERVEACRSSDTSFLRCC
jgi:hypothetical protein